MTTEDPLKNWQLENREQDADQWKLEDAEQDLNKHLELQPGEPNAYWQPIEYERSTQPRRRNWVIPSVLIVALLAVLGYVGWIAFSQLGSDSGFSLASFIPGMAAEATATPTDEPVAAAAKTTSETTPTIEPTATSAPAETPTPTIEPTPTVAMAQLISGTVNAVGGVNARREPAITGELVQLLNEGAQVVVTRQDGDWLQVILPDGATVAWVAAEFIDRTTQSVTLTELATRYTAAGLPAPAAEAAPASVLPAATVSATGEIAGIATTENLTGALAATVTSSGPPVLATSGIVPDAPFTNTLPLVGPALTVTDTTGVNARSAPSTGGAIIVTVPNGAVLPVTGRSVAGDWLQVRLPDGATAWMFADAVVASADAASAPVVEEAAGGITATTAPTETTTAPGAPSGVTATVTNGLGANLRSAPSRDLDSVFVAAQNDVFTVVGRSGDDEWVQVALPDGTLAWVLVTAVQLNADVNTLPVTQP